MTTLNPCLCEMCLVLEERYVCIYKCLLIQEIFPKVGTAKMKKLSYSILSSYSTFGKIQVNKHNQKRLSFKGNVHEFLLG